MKSDKDRIIEFLTYIQKSNNAAGISIGDKNGMRFGNVIKEKNKISQKLARDIVKVYPEISYEWLLNGTGEKLISPEVSKKAVVNSEIVTPKEKFSNNNGNNFIELPNGQYYMTMPLAEFSIQAGLLDHYQDADFLMDLEQHGMIVDKPVQGRYVAFRVDGNSMDDGTVDSIPRNSIVSTRELQKQHWKNKIRFKDFQYWVIYTSQSKQPLVKEITEHDVDSGIITCHSLNDSPEFSDFTLHLDDVQALFYVVQVTRNVSNKLYY